MHLNETNTIPSMQQMSLVKLKVKLVLEVYQKFSLFLSFSWSTAPFPTLVIVEEQQKKSEIKFYNSKEYFSGDLSE